MSLAAIIEISILNPILQHLSLLDQSQDIRLQRYSERINATTKMIGYGKKNIIESMIINTA